MLYDFSIVIPAYNNSDLFRRAIESVRCQQGVSLEIVVVDDSNNNDDIEQYINSIHDSRIIYRHNVPPLGAVKNWNAGLNICQGKNIILLHHDEELKENNYLMRVKSLLNHIDIVVCNVEIHRNDGKVYGLASQFIKNYAIHHPFVLFAFNLIGPSAVIAFRKEKMQLFDEQTHWFVDVEWYYRMLNAHQACYLSNATIISHHGHHGQITTTINTSLEAQKDTHILKKKYSTNLLVLIAIWMHIYIIHNNTISYITKRLLRR